MGSLQNKTKQKHKIRVICVEIDHNTPKDKKDVCVCVCVCVCMCVLCGVHRREEKGPRTNVRVDRDRTNVGVAPGAFFQDVCHDLLHFPLRLCR